MRNDFPLGEYLFSFFLLSGDTDYTIVNYNVNPIAGHPVITNPMLWDVEVPLNPVYTWTDSSSFAEILAMGVWDVTADAELYKLVPEFDIFSTQWQPGWLQPLNDYDFWIGAFVGDFDIPSQTVWLDDFTYRGLFVSDDDIQFTTAPEPFTLGLVASGLLVLGGVRRRWAFGEK